MTTQTSKVAEATPERPTTERRPLPEIPSWRRKLRPYLLSIPALVIVIGILYPFVLGAYYAFLNYAAVNPDPQFVGFRNFGSVLGDQIFWLGMSGLGEPLVQRGSDWTNVYKGQLAGDTITGRYADVPQGTTLLDGPVVMKLTKTADGGISLVRTTPDTGTEFGGRVFTPCTLG